MRRNPRLAENLAGWNGWVQAFRKEESLVIRHSAKLDAGLASEFEKWIDDSLKKLRRATVVHEVRLITGPVCSGLRSSVLTDKHAGMLRNWFSLRATIERVAIATNQRIPSFTDFIDGWHDTVRYELRMLENE